MQLPPGDSGANSRPAPSGGARPAPAPTPPPAPRDILTVVAADSTGLLLLDDPVRLQETAARAATLTSSQQQLVSRTADGLLQLGRDRDARFDQPTPAPRRTRAGPQAPTPDPLADLKTRLDALRNPFRSEVPQDARTLTPEQQAMRTALHARIAAGSLPIQRRVRDAVINQWDAFDRGCLIAAVVHWARLQLNTSIAQPQLRLAADARPEHRARVAALLPGHPMLRLYLVAERQLLLLTRCISDTDPCAPARQPPVPVPPAWPARPKLPEETARALTALAWSCGNGGDFTPPLVQRRLRALHRHMTGAVAWSARLLEYARALNLDNARLQRRDLVAWRNLTLPAASRGQINPLLRRTLDWLVPGAGDDADRTTRALASWRTTRNEHLGAMLRAPLLADPCPPSSVGPSPATLFELFPEAMRRLLEGQPEPPAANPAPPSPPARGTRTRRPPRANQDRLDELWCWYHDHKTGGYLLPRQRTRADDAVAFAETRWINLVSTISNLYDRLGDAGFDLQSRRFGVGTYPGHGNASYDLSLPPRTPIHVARPAELYLGAQVFGNDPGAPRGLYRAQSWSTTRLQTSPLQEQWDKWEYAMLGRNFDLLWRTAVDAVQPPEQAARIRDSGSSARRQYLFVFNSNLAVRAQLIDTDADSPGARPRRIDASRFLAGLFFERTVLDSNLGASYVADLRVRMRNRLLQAIRERHDAPPAGWSARAWDRLLEHAIRGRTDDRGSTNEWQEALLYQRNFLREVFDDFRARGFDAAGNADLPAPLRDELTRSSDRLSSAARAQLRAGFNAIVQSTRQVMARATAGGSATRVHEIFVEFLAHVLARVDEDARRAAARSRHHGDVRGSSEQDGAPPPPQVREQHRGGAEVDVTYRYILDRADDGSAPNQRSVWVTLVYSHMASVAGIAQGGPELPRPGSTDLTTPTAPLIGLSGATGNAASPHAHMALSISTHPPDAPHYRAEALLSPFDFLGPVAWEDRDSSGPAGAPFDEALGPATGASWPLRARDVRPQSARALA